MRTGFEEGQEGLPVVQRTIPLEQKAPPELLGGPPLDEELILLPEEDVVLKRQVSFKSFVLGGIKLLFGVGTGRVVESLTV